MGNFLENNFLLPKHTHEKKTLIIFITFLVIKYSIIQEALYKKHMRFFFSKSNTKNIPCNYA